MSAPKRGTQVSVRGETYDRLRAEADKHGVTVSAIVEAAVADVRPCEPPEAAPPEPERELGRAETFTCSVCIREATEIPSLEPFGRDSALVKLCSTCAHGRVESW